jgi:hypothetical protein
MITWGRAEVLPHVRRKLRSSSIRGSSRAGPRHLKSWMSTLFCLMSSPESVGPRQSTEAL